MRKLFDNDFIVRIMLVGVAIILILMTKSIWNDHDDIAKQITTLQTDVTKLRAELKAHDQKPEWFERKE